MTLRDRLFDATVRAMASGPVRSVALGCLALLIGARLFGWTAVGLLIAGAVVDFAWCAMRVPRWWL